MYIQDALSKTTWQHIWAFRRLWRYVEYKTEEYGVEVVQIDPRNTSKWCSTRRFICQISFIVIHFEEFQV